MALQLLLTSKCLVALKARYPLGCWGCILLLWHGICVFLSPKLQQTQTMKQNIKRGGIQRQKEPSSPSELGCQKGVNLMDQERYEDAPLIFKTALSQNPTHHAALGNGYHVHPHARGVVAFGSCVGLTLTRGCGVEYGRSNANRPGARCADDGGVAQKAKAHVIIHWDQGSQFGSDEFNRWCKDNVSTIIQDATFRVFEMCC